jgi:hypothetical protein
VRQEARRQREGRLAGGASVRCSIHGGNKPVRAPVQRDARRRALLREAREHAREAVSDQADEAPVQALRHVEGHDRVRSNGRQQRGLREGLLRRSGRAQHGGGAHEAVTEGQVRVARCRGRRRLLLLLHGLGAAAPRACGACRSRHRGRERLGEGCRARDDGGGCAAKARVPPV